MRRLIGVAMILFGALALYCAWQAFGSHLPASTSMIDPVFQYTVGGVISLVFGILLVFRRYEPIPKGMMECPSCGKMLQKGPQQCPACKQDLMKY